MAWNPNVPTVTNRVQDDLDAIRENFQHLDQSRIVEMGSNSNGTYVRWENGLQVCYGIRTFTDLACNNQLGGSGFFRNTSADGEIVLPAAFASANYSIMAAEGNGVSLYSPETIGISHVFCWSSSSARVFVMRYGSGTIASLPVGFIAIGRWK